MMERQRSESGWCDNRISTIVNVRCTSEVEAGGIVRVFSTDSAAADMAEVVSRLAISSPFSKIQVLCV